MPRSSVGAPRSPRTSLDPAIRGARHHAHESAPNVSASAEAEAGSGTCPIQSPLRSGGFQDAKLHERGDPVVESDFIRDLAVLDTQYDRPREVHLPTRCRRQRASEKIAESRSGMGAATFPLPDDVIALGDKVGRAPELEVRERGAEIHHEIPHVLATPTRRMQRILEQHVGRGEFVDDLWVPGVTPESVEPASDDGLVVLFA